MKDSFHAAYDFRSTVVPDNCIFYRCDAKDFYLSGNQSELIEDVINNFEKGPRAQLLKLVLQFLLKHQYIRSQYTPGDTFRCTQGSGMGTRFGGYVADLALLSKVEWWCTAPGVQKKNGIIAYWRFRDDLLFLSKGPGEKFVPFFHEFRQKAGYFKILLEEVGYEVEYLDMKVTINDHHLSITPKLKGSTMVTPLAIDSCHPSTAHAYWPTAMMARLSKIGAGCSGTDKVLQELRQRFHEAGRSLQPPRPRQKPTEADGVSVSWLPISFNPVLVRPMKKSPQ